MLRKWSRSFGTNLLSVVLVGRPNTGKSTLFNRLTKSKLAIVSSIAGTTRDRRDGKGNLAGLTFNLIDTGGLDDRGNVQEQVQGQVSNAVLSADVILFMIDSKEGITSLDLHFAKWIRRILGHTRLLSESSVNVNVNEIDSKDVLLVANKTEGAHLSDRVLEIMSEASRLGFGSPIPISAAHGDGISDLASSLIMIAKKRGLDNGAAIVPMKQEDLSQKDRVIELAVMGKPNVGKSTFINALLKENRLITGPTAGLTRDAIPIEWIFAGRKIKLVDTAGITKISPDLSFLRNSEEMKKTRDFEAMGIFNTSLPGTREMNPEEDPSQFSQLVSELALISAMNSLRFANVVVLMVESSQGKFSHTDIQLVRKCLEEGRALVVVANKCDLLQLKGISQNEYQLSVRNHCQELFPEFGLVPVVACSALNGQGIHRVMTTVLQTHFSWDRRIDTWILNKWLKDLLVTSPAPRSGGRRLQIKYITQVKSRPPTFAIFSNSNEIPPAFARFLRSNLQKSMNMHGVPLRFISRKSSGAEVKKNLLAQGKITSTGSGNSSSRPVGLKRSLGGTLFSVRKNRDSQRRRASRIMKARKSN